jgi:diguanylate cyclase (GGDEF)-like protein
VQHENLAKQPKYSLRQRLHPGRIVNICFIIVLIFSTLLTWREVVVLEDAYISSQRNHLETVVNSLDRQLEYSVDKLLFFRNGMYDALHTPLLSSVLRQSVARFSDLRSRPSWQLTFDEHRTLPLNGVSDEFVKQTNSLSRDDDFVPDELTAALEVGYLMRITSPLAKLAKRIMYVSRAGFYVSNNNSDWGNDIPSRYYHLVISPWFTQQSERNNSSRGVRWFTRPAQSWPEGEQTVTVSVPVDHQHYWYGVLAIDFTVTAVRELLNEAVGVYEDGEFQLYDNQLTLLASSEKESAKINHFDERERAQIAFALQHDTEGGLRLGSRYLSWHHLDHFDGVLLRVHRLDEGMQGDFGRISVVLALLWLLSTAMLLGSWLVIRRMVSNMYSLQHTLQWQAWHDPMTRLHNRGALFDRAIKMAAACQKQQQPFSVIQMDLDHFKGINDVYGHQAGDKVLIHSAGLIASTLREGDVAGRVGGEEFCVVLPNTSLAQAAVVAERIRARINRREILVKKSQTVRISVSIGVSSAQAGEDYEFEQLQSIADARLYQAKQSGRNRVVSQDEK